jgi:RimJ/RimL family protein N-acetyltransferase
MTFELGDYVLREPRAEDAEGLVKITHDREAMAYYGTSGAFFATCEDAHHEIEWFKGLFTDHGGRWIITEKGNDTYIGDIGFHNYAVQHRRVEIGYKLSRAYWGKGIITGCIRLLVHWGFTERDYNRIEALVDTANEGSKIVLLRNQFQRDGILRAYEFEHGHFVDLEMYSLLRKDYAAPGV